MQRVILQVPMSRELKEKAQSVSTDMGFSSLQEAIRVLLTKLSRKELAMTIEPVEEISHLSRAAEARFAKAVRDIKAGRNIYRPKNKKELFELLRS